MQRIIDFCHAYSVKPSLVNGLLETVGTTPLHGSAKVVDLVARPQITLKMLGEHIAPLRETLYAAENRQEEIIEEAEISIKYKGYIDRERLFADKMHRLENIRIKGRFDYPNIKDLSTECRQKLERIQPETLAQASRIPGVSPSDINVLLVLLGR